MPIKTHTEERFSKGILGGILHTHRLAILFGVLFPLLAFFLAGLKSGSFFGVWPTVLTQGYEYVFLYGWGGLYLFGLLYLVYPELIDVVWNKKEQHRYKSWTNLYVLGLILYIIGVVIDVQMSVADLSRLFFFAGSLVSFFAWVGAEFHYFQIMKRRSKSLFDQLVRLSVLPFTAALLILPIVFLFLFGNGSVLLPVGLAVPLRFLPLSGIGLIVLTILIRMLPEMLSWRPLHESHLRMSYLTILVFSILSLLSYVWFHASHSGLSAVIYGLSALGSLTGIVLLYSALDFWKIRLDRGERKEHVSFIYGALIWLILCAGLYLLFAITEIRIAAQLSKFFGDTLMLVFFAGFIAQAIFGLYTYVIGQAREAHPHRDIPATLVFTIINWTLVIRLLIYPMMIFTGWPGAEIFRWFLDILLFLGLILMSADILHGIGGHKFQRRKG